MSAFDGRMKLAGLVAAGVVVADRLSKMLVESTLVPHRVVHILPCLALTYVRNTGAAFGLLASAPAHLRLPFLVLSTVLAGAVLLWFLRETPADRRWQVGALGGILGGAVGNLIDRLRYGEVIDFVDLHWAEWHWPAFNVADAAITVGVVLLLVLRTERR